MAHCIEFASDNCQDFMVPSDASLAMIHVPVHARVTESLVQQLESELNSMRTVLTANSMNILMISVEGLVTGNGNIQYCE